MMQRDALQVTAMVELPAQRVGIQAIGQARILDDRAKRRRVAAEHQRYADQAILARHRDAEFLAGRRCGNGRGDAGQREERFPGGLPGFEDNLAGGQFDQVHPGAQARIRAGIERSEQQVLFRLW